MRIGPRMPGSLRRISDNFATYCSKISKDVSEKCTSFKESDLFPFAKAVTASLIAAYALNASPQNSSNMNILAGSIASGAGLTAALYALNKGSDIVTDAVEGIKKIGRGAKESILSGLSSLPEFAVAVAAVLASQKYGFIDIEKLYVSIHNFMKSNLVNPIITSAGALYLGHLASKQKSSYAKKKPILLHPRHIWDTAWGLLLGAYITHAVHGDGTLTIPEALKGLMLSSLYFAPQMNGYLKKLPEIIKEKVPAYARRSRGSRFFSRYIANPVMNRYARIKRNLENRYKKEFKTMESELNTTKGANAKETKRAESPEDGGSFAGKIWKNVRVPFLLGGGMMLLKYSSDLAVDNLYNFGEIMGWGGAALASLSALGTSMPEGFVFSSYAKKVWNAISKGAEKIAKKFSEAGDMAFGVVEKSAIYNSIFCFASTLPSKGGLLYDMSKISDLYTMLGIQALFLRSAIKGRFTRRTAAGVLGIEALNMSGAFDRAYEALSPYMHHAINYAHKILPAAQHYISSAFQ